MSSPEGAARVLLGAEGGVLAAVHRLEVVARLGHGHHGRGHVPAPRLDSRAGGMAATGHRIYSVSIYSQSCRESSV